MSKEKLTFKNIAERLTEPTPPFWKKVRNTMLAVGVVSGALLVAPVALPAVVITLAGYGIAIGTVGTVLAQTTSSVK
jgi:hypothetical protein